jgi:hypothetical protein
MPKKTNPSVLSYATALSLWQDRQQILKLRQTRSQGKAKKSSQVLKSQLQLGIARAKDWAATEFGSSHNSETNQEDLESSIPDGSALHPNASPEDIQDHLRKAIESIGLKTDISEITLRHPVVQKEYILILLRFDNSSIPSKADFVLLVQLHLSHLQQAFRQLDQAVSLACVKSKAGTVKDEPGEKP